jgi:hypothetical protein
MPAWDALLITAGEPSDHLKHLTRRRRSCNIQPLLYSEEVGMRLLGPVDDDKPSWNGATFSVAPLV